MFSMCMASRILFRICVILAWFHSTKSADSKDPKQWWTEAQEQLQLSLSQKVNTNTAKNVILFIGDGMGVSTVTAARILKGQLRNMSGEETILEFEKFPYVALSKTYVTDRQVPDSAATATAIMSGIKTKWMYVGVDGTNGSEDCTYNSRLETILDWSQKEGKSTGIVTNSRITHATPAALYAHVPNRYWESDTSLPNTTKCQDIAYQLIHENNNIEVVFGGGRSKFLPETEDDNEKGGVTRKYHRQDGLNLIQEWKTIIQKKGRRPKFLWNNTEFDTLDPNEVDYVLGLFESSHMQYELERDKGPSGEPSLEQMTSKAIQILQKNSKGFFLLVEGGRIDHAHHDSKAKKALYETLAFEDAIKTAVEQTKEEETLIVVTADHSHVFNIAGYPKRGNDILGIVDPLPKKWYPMDNKPYTTLLYANGPGWSEDRQDPRNTDTAGDNYIQTSAVPLSQETHGGEDVTIYARGPMSHLFRGVKEQHYIAHVMAYASCVGTNQNHCSTRITNSAFSNVFNTHDVLGLLSILLYRIFVIHVHG